MAKFIRLDPMQAKQLRTVDERLMSYNIEMTEVTGGTFWKADTPGQIAGTEEVPPLKNMADRVKLQEWYDPIDTTNERLINLYERAIASKNRWIRWLFIVILVLIVFVVGLLIFDILDHNHGWYQQTAGAIVSSAREQYIFFEKSGIGL